MKLETTIDWISTNERRRLTSHICGKCYKFRCPLVMKYSNVIGCDRDVMEQIWASKKSKGKVFEQVAAELGI